MVLVQRVINRNDILKNINSVEIFKNYFPNFELNTRLSSPFRSDDDPSFGFFVGTSGEVVYNDFSRKETGDCFSFVSRLFNNLSFFETLSKIATDFNLPKSGEFFYKDMSSIKSDIVRLSKEQLEGLNSVKDTEIKVRFREWSKIDADYWSSFGITYKVLKYYKVFPVSHIFVNSTVIKADELAYVFVENKDGLETFKIYQPFNKSGLKWLSSHNNSVWQGWSQLPESHHSLIITKSLKDVMTIVSITGLPATAMQSENVKPKPQIIEELKKRFETIYVLYDNDYDKVENIGKKLGDNLSIEIGGSIRIEIPDDKKVTDISEYSEKYGSKEAAYFINNNIVPF